MRRHEHKSSFRAMSKHVEKSLNLIARMGIATLQAQRHSRNASIAAVP
jgi:hypothetical protein